MAIKWFFVCVLVAMHNVLFCLHRLLCNDFPFLSCKLHDQWSRLSNMSRGCYIRNCKYYSILMTKSQVIVDKEDAGLAASHVAVT